MVVPLKLTQFYGHSVPRPRIYDAVKFNDQRVDPPPSVNDALLSWASEAHWSMGGLSLKRVRTLGKMEGNVRRLRALAEDEEGLGEAEPQPKRAATSKPAEAKVNSAVSKRASLSAEKKRQRNEDESVEETPARKLRKRGILQDATEGGSPTFVPATEEKLQKKSRPIRQLSAEDESAQMTKKTGLQSPSSIRPVHAPSSEAVTQKRREVAVSADVKKQVRGSKSPASVEKRTTELSPVGDDGRLTRSAKRGSDNKLALSQRPSKGLSRARRILKSSFAGDEEFSSE